MGSTFDTTPLTFQEKSLRLYEALGSGKGISHIAQVASEVLNNPVSISDSSFRLLEYSKHMEVNDPVWSDIIDNGIVSLEVIEKFNEERIIDRILSSDLPVLISDGIGEDIRRILGKISISDNIIGYVGIFEVRHPLTEEDLLLTDILTSVLSAELSKNPTVSKLTGTLAENLVIDLINDVPMEENEIDQRLKASGWSPLSNFYLLYIPMEPTIHTPYKVEYLYSFLPHFSEQIRCTYHNQAILALVSFNRKEELDPFWEMMESLLKSNVLTCGVSFQFDHLKKLKSAYEQAESTCRLGSTLAAESSVWFFDDYYDFYLMSELQSNLPITDYVHRGIQNLIQYDAEHNSSYALTLFLYITTQFNLSETAKKLFIHRNSMIHRLNRILEITGISSFEEEDLFRILLTFKINKFQKGLS